MSNETTYSRLMARGKSFFRKQKYHDSLNCFINALKVVKDDSEALLLKSICQYSIGEILETSGTGEKKKPGFQRAALAELKDLCQSNPTLDSHFYLGMCYYQIYRLTPQLYSKMQLKMNFKSEKPPLLENAVTHLKKALEFDASRNDILLNLGICLMEDSEFLHAIKIFQNIVNTEEGAGIISAWNYLGDCYSSLGEFEEAIGAYKIAIDKHIPYRNIANYMATRKSMDLRNLADRFEIEYDEIELVIEDLKDYGLLKYNLIDGDKIVDVRFLENIDLDIYEKEIQSKDRSVKYKESMTLIELLTKLGQASENAGKFKDAIDVYNDALEHGQITLWVQTIAFGSEKSAKSFLSTKSTSVGGGNLAKTAAYAVAAVVFIIVLYMVLYLMVFNPLGGF